MTEQELRCAIKKSSKIFCNVIINITDDFKNTHSFSISKKASLEMIEHSISEGIHEFTARTAIFNKKTFLFIG